MEEVKVMEEEELDTKVVEPGVKEPSPKESIVETIIQNGVSREELRAMLDEILNKPTPEQLKADIEKAEKDYFFSHIQY